MAQQPPVDYLTTNSHLAQFVVHMLQRYWWPIQFVQTAAILILSKLNISSVIALLFSSMHHLTLYFWISVGHQSILELLFVSSAVEYIVAWEYI